MNKFDSFLSYAGEDEDFAKELAGALKAKGFNIWYAPINLILGDKLLDSIEKGMNDSSSSILLISPEYLKKGWTNYEMDILIRQNIENGKSIFPIWHNVTKNTIENRHSGLAGIIAINTNLGFPYLVVKLTEALAKQAPTIGVVPEFESPFYKFLRGSGEIMIGVNGPVTTLWEFLIHSKDFQYPLYLGGNLYSKKDLLFEAAQSIPHIPDTVKNWVGDDGYDKIWQMCLDGGINPKQFE